MNNPMDYNGQPHGLPHGLHHKRPNGLARRLAHMVT